MNKPRLLVYAWAQRAGLSILSFISLVACGVTSKHSTEDKKANAPVEVSDEVSLKADRSQYADMRKDISEEVKKENDELAIVLDMLTKGDEEPNKIRDRFDKAIRSRRDKEDKILRKKRDDFTKNERKSRDEFLAKLKSDRDEFVKRKMTSEERKKMFDDQDTKRHEYFADEQDKRREFESDISENRKTFEDYAREKQNKFNSDLREYTTNYYERQKGLALKKRAEEKAKVLRDAEAKKQAEEANRDPLLDEFKQIPKTPPTQLGPQDLGN
jgi:hypothetical protein